MDTQKSTASRIRQILASMERSIDTARSRRVNTTSGAAHALPERPVTSALQTDRMAVRPDVPAMAPVSKVNQVIGGPSPVAGAVPVAPKPPVDPSQPPRLKARPKRFEGTFPAPFTQPAYRSQTG